MSNEKFDSVWDAIEDTPEEAENMKLRSSLIMALKDHLRNRPSILNIDYFTAEHEFEEVILRILDQEQKVGSNGT